MCVCVSGGIGGEGRREGESEREWAGVRKEVGYDEEECRAMRSERH